VLVEINRLITEYRKKGEKTGVMASRESAPDIECDAKYILGSIDDMKEVTSRLFSGLRFLDEACVDVGRVEGVFPEKREGRAIMNRLRKAAKEKVSCYK